LKRIVPDSQKRRMKRIPRTIQKFSKEGIMVRKSQKVMNAEEVYLQEYLLSLGIKEVLIIVKETTKEKIVIN
jgi:hypothetical protein